MKVLSSACPDGVQGWGPPSSKGEGPQQREEMRAWFPKNSPGKGREMADLSQDGVKGAPAGCVAFVETATTFKSGNKTSWLTLHLASDWLIFYPSPWHPHLWPRPHSLVCVWASGVNLPQGLLSHGFWRAASTVPTGCDSQLYPRSGQLLKVLDATSGSSNPWAEEKKCKAEEQSSQEILSYVEFKRMRYV